jgi:pyroglutamyl-peptidase
MHIEVFTKIVPVVWAATRCASSEAILSVAPDAVLHLGVSRHAVGFEIETRAFNMSSRKKDDAGFVRPQGRLIPQGEPILKTTMPSIALVRALRASGFQATLSNDAGRYLCNALYYWSLANAGGDGPMVSFIHMPALGIDGAALSRLTMEKAIQGAKILIRATADAVVRARLNKTRQRTRRNVDGPQRFHRAEHCNRRIVWSGTS